MSKNYYDILGVSKSATAEEIKKAYRKLALENHPDRGGSPEQEKKFKEVNEAYQVLSDPEKRQQFDQFGDSAFHSGGGGRQSGYSGFGGSNGSPFEGFDFSDFAGGGFSSGGGLGDIFEEFFGQSLSQVQAELSISPAQAILGGNMKIEVGGEKLEFSLPAGVQSGASFRFAGKGRAYRGGKKGDLVLTIKIEMPRHISREQRELWEKLRDSETKKKWWN